MTDLKFHLLKFDVKPSSDYSLWLCRLEEILEAKCLADTIQASNETSISVRDIASSADPEATLQMRWALSIIFNGLGDKPLLVFRVHCKGPLRTIFRVHCKGPLRTIPELNERYESSTLSSRMSLM
jgi:hypothetical protein